MVFMYAPQVDVVHGITKFVATFQGPLLLAWINFNPSMDKQLNPL